MARNGWVCHNVVKLLSDGQWINYVHLQWDEDAIYTEYKVYIWVTYSIAKRHYILKPLKTTHTPTKIPKLFKWCFPSIIFLYFSSPSVDRKLLKMKWLLLTTMHSWSGLGCSQHQINFVAYMDNINVCLKHLHSGSLQNPCNTVVLKALCLYCQAFTWGGGPPWIFVAPPPLKYSRIIYVSQLMLALPC